MDKEGNSQEKEEKNASARSFPFVKQEEGQELAEDSRPTVKVEVHNVVFGFKVPLRLEMEKILSLDREDIEIKHTSGYKYLYLKMKEPKNTVKICASGSVVGFGAESETTALEAADLIVSMLQTLDYDIKLDNFRILNVVATCRMPFGIKLRDLADSHRMEASYEPELSNCLHYKIRELGATINVHHTGSLIIFAPSTEQIVKAVTHISPILDEFRRSMNPPDSEVDLLLKFIEELSAQDTIEDFEAFVRAYESLESFALRGLKIE